MKMNLNLLLCVALLASAPALFGTEAADKAETVKITQGASGEAILTLTAETQKRIGLVTTNPAAAEWQPEIRATGHALDTAPLADLMMDYGRALLAFDGSHQDLERSKRLKKDDNLSERAFQDAETTYRLNFATVMAARLKIEAAWGKRIAAMLGEIVVPPGTPRKPFPELESLLAGGVLIRVDLPMGERLMAPSTAQIVPLAKRDAPITASFFDKFPTMDAATQQQGLIFAIGYPTTADRLLQGESVTAFVKNSEPPVKGVTVPAVAILRHENKGWVFVQTGATDFARREVSLDRAVEDGFFSDTLSATNHVVVTGAQTLLSAELSAGNFNAGGRD